MIRIIKKIPKKVTVACSGGIDSMVFVHFLLRGKKDVQLAYFNHDTAFARKSEQFVQEFAEDNRLKLHIGRVKGRKEKRSFLLRGEVNTNLKKLLTLSLSLSLSLFPHFSLNELRASSKKI